MLKSDLQAWPQLVPYRASSAMHMCTHRRPNTHPLSLEPGSELLGSGLQLSFCLTLAGCTGSARPTTRLLCNPCLNGAQHYRDGRSATRAQLWYRAQTMTEKKLRKQLEADLGVDLVPRKDFVRTVVSLC